MERLTYWCPDGTGEGEWRANVRGAEEAGEVIDRLAAYEDTGLEPEEVEIMRENKADAQFMLTKLCRLPDYGRLEELARADQDGRLVVLPCKVGDTVYICSKELGIRVEKVRTFFLGHPSYRIEDRKMKMVRTETCDIPFSELGTKLFLTREEAEAALEGGRKDAVP